MLGNEMLRVSSSTAKKCELPEVLSGPSLTKLRNANGSIGIMQERRKRVFDFLVASFLLVFLSPLLLITAIAIKVSSRGPVLFRQERYGRFKVPFEILKFRTMTVLENGDDFKQATRNDSRITRLGAFLRRTSIDELPQLWNVMRGDMSLVGPRPHAIAMDDDYATRIPGYDRRFLLRPGITGLAQSSGYRGETDHLDKMVGRIDCDVHYVFNRTMMMDINILGSTVVALVRHDAY